MDEIDHGTTSFDKSVQGLGFKEVSLNQGNPRPFIERYVGIVVNHQFKVEVTPR
jgi:hypothetical protein